MSTRLTPERAEQIREAVKSSRAPETEADAIDLLLLDHEVWEKHSLTQLVQENRDLKAERDRLHQIFEATMPLMRRAPDDGTMPSHDW